MAHYGTEYSPTLITALIGICEHVYVPIFVHIEPLPAQPDAAPGGCSTQLRGHGGCLGRRVTKRAIGVSTQVLKVGSLVSTCIHRFYSLFALWTQKPHIA